MDWRKEVIVPLYKDEVSKGNCWGFREISLLSAEENIYFGNLVEKGCRVMGGLIDEEQCIEKWESNFTLKK